MKIRNNLFTLLYSLGFYLAVLMIPYDMFSSSEHVILLIKILALLAYLVFLFYDLFYKKNINFKATHLIYLPLLIGCFSNFFSLPFVNFSTCEVDGILLFEAIIFTIIQAISEEIIFRHVAFNLFEGVFKNSKYNLSLTILCSSALFGLMHFINAFGNNILLVLEQVGYTFVLGIVLGIIKGKDYNLVFPILGHALFNIINNVIFTSLFKIEVNIAYYIISVIVILLVLGYTISIFLLRKKGEKDVS